MQTAIGQDLVLLLPRLRRYALSLTRSSTEADDLVQTACVKALAGASGWTPGTRFDAWVFRVLRNAWIDGLRRRKVAGVVADVEAVDGEVHEPGERRAMAKLTLDDVRRAIDALPADQREVVLLVCVEELSYREVAEVLDVPIGTVMSRLARARRRLAEATDAA